MKSPQKSSTTRAPWNEGRWVAMSPCPCHKLGVPPRFPEPHRWELRPAGAPIPLDASEVGLAP